MIPLQWVRFQQTGYIARCGDVDIGMVALKADGSYHWKIDGVYMKWIAKSYGDVKTLDTAKAAITRGWRTWLLKAGICQPERTYEEEQRAFAAIGVKFKRV